MLNMVWLDTNKTPKKQTATLEENLRKFGSLISYPHTNSNEIVERSINAEILLVNKVMLQAEHLQLLPNLKYIIVIATGYDNIDVRGANKLGILVSNIPDYSTLTVAQHTIALLLELTNQVGRVNQNLKISYNWIGGCHKLLELAGLTLGVVGFGQIAKAVIKIATALGMKVIVTSNGRNYYVTDLPVSFVSLDTLYKTSDVISLHCPLNTHTHNLINTNSLELMKPNALLINTARGKLVDEEALYLALSNRTIQGAALDVLNIEPPESSNPLFGLDNCIITPHNAWLSDAALSRWINVIISSINGYLNGSLINRIALEQ
jgi:glycerate dehydrogenase